MYTIRIKQSSHGCDPETQIHAPAAEIIKNWFLETNPMLHDKNNTTTVQMTGIKQICQPFVHKKLERRKNHDKMPFL